MGCGSSHPRGDGQSEEITPSGILWASGYDTVETLGEGAFGEVIRVIYEDTGNQYACKKLKSSLVQMSSLRTEMAILQACRHPNIVFLREVLVSQDKQVHIVLELAQGGCLLDRILENEGLPESYAASVTIQLASALQYLHGHAIVHRDM